MLESFIGSFAICQLLCKLLQQDNAFFKCFIGGFLPRILFEKQRISFDVYCQFTFFRFEPGLCHICFCLASYVIFGKFFHLAGLFLLVQWTTYVIYDLGIVLALVFLLRRAFTLPFECTTLSDHPLI